MWGSKNRLIYKVGFYLISALTTVAILFTYMIVRHNRDELLNQAARHNAQLSEVVIKSTRFAMLQNKPSHVSQIIRDVGDQDDIEKVRILSKNGTIIHSSLDSEVGTKIDQEVESCLGCHRNENTRKNSPQIGRPRFFTDSEGQRMLGSTAVIRNEATCSSAACHQHPENVSVLGVLDIVYPLNAIEQILAQETRTIIGFALGFVILTGFLVSYLVHRLVYNPLRDLEEGASRIAAGDLEKKIPVRSADEFGQLAESFNSMTAALRKSHVDLENWGRTLEQKVEEASYELRKAQAETARSEKLASVGLLAAGIAHELNNPLTGVLTFAHLVRKNLPEGSRDAEDLDLVIRETKRCAAIIRRLLDFSREKTPERSYCDINKMVKETCYLIEQPAQVEDIEIQLDLDESIPEIWVDENLIKQVIMNMLVNAQHAIEAEGTITIRTRVRADFQMPNSDGVAQKMVEISIRDTGCGISEEHTQKIFDPFFTTKGVGKGTGLGLSVSHGTVEAHGGCIEVDSIVDEGTEFRIYLPVASNGSQGSEL